MFGFCRCVTSAGAGNCPCLFTCLSKQSLLTVKLQFLYSIFTAKCYIAHVHAPIPLISANMSIVVEGNGILVSTWFRFTSKHTKEAKTTSMILEVHGELINFGS